MASKVKASASALCKKLSLDKMAKSISQSKTSSLEIFFTVLTHKDDSPFTCMVSERGSWQHQVSHFLQKHLSMLKLLDPYATKNSDEVVSFSKEGMPIGYAFSVDVTYLFHSIPHKDLCGCSSTLKTALLLPFRVPVA